MKKKIIKYFFIVLVLSFSDVAVSAELRSDAERYERVEYLQSLIDSIKSDITEKEAQIKQDTTPQRVHYLSMEIADLRNRLEIAEKDFIDYAADVSLFESQELSSAQSKSLLDDFQDVVTPLVSSLKRASERPRRIERLKAQIASLNSKLKQADKGIESIEYLLESAEKEDLKQKLSDAKLKVVKYRSDINFRHGILQDQLEEELKSNKSFVQSAEEILRDFFSNKGENLLIAFLTTLVVLLLLFAIEKFILKPYLYVSRFHFISKPIESLYGLMTIVIGILAGLFSLYILDDWFLFTFFLLLLVGIIWSLKHLVVRFMDAIKLMLGLGTIKAGQRIVYEGCPWRVKKIRMNTILENEFLEGGVMNVDITKLMELSSRKMHKDDSLFPTKKGDWVILSDGVYGRVATQTPEQVIVEVNGVTPAFYRTQDYLSLRPQNLSSGFVVEHSIGLDYKHQKQMTDIVEVFSTSISGLVAKGLVKDKKALKDVNVYFAKAATHSLDIGFEIHFDGALASRYKQILGLVQSSIVEICTKNKYEIAFEQLKVFLPR